MLSHSILARAEWYEGTRMDAMVHLLYLPKTDPWLIHVNLEVSNVSTEFEIDRMTLMRVVCIVPDFRWLTDEGAPLRTGFSPEFVRFRLNNTTDGTWTNFDMERQPVLNFLHETNKLVSHKAEEAAFNAHLDRELENL